MKATYRNEEILITQNAVTGEYHWHTEEATSDQRNTWYQQVVMVPEPGFASAEEALAAAKNHIDRTEESMAGE